MAKEKGSTPEKEKEATFEDLYEIWCDSVFRYLMHLVGSPDVVEDLFQETWMKALECRCQLEKPDRFGPWIMRIARNLTYNFMRNRRRKVQVWLFSHLAHADGEPAGVLERQGTLTQNPRETAITAQRFEIIQKAIAKLDLVSQEMLQLRYFEGCTLSEVAEILGVPLGTVCTKIHRSLKTIRRQLQRQGFHSLREI